MGQHQKFYNVQGKFFEFLVEGSLNQKFYEFRGENSANFLRRALQTSRRKFHELLDVCSTNCSVFQGEFHQFHETSRTKFHKHFEESSRTKKKSLSLSCVNLSTNFSQKTSQTSRKKFHQLPLFSRDVSHVSLTYQRKFPGLSKEFP